MTGVTRVNRIFNYAGSKNDIILMKKIGKKNQRV
jgi:hypothetical protein